MLDLSTRFWSKVDRSGECWRWTGTKNAKGYGVIAVDGHNRPAHRIALELEGCPPPSDLTVDHLCRVRDCVRPSHLEVVTRGENTLRGATITAANRAKTECPKGHPYHVRRDGTRDCQTCKEARNREYYHRDRLAHLTGGTR